MILLDHVLVHQKKRVRFESWQQERWATDIQQYAHKRAAYRTWRFTTGNRQRILRDVISEACTKKTALLQNTPAFFIQPATPRAAAASREKTPARSSLQTNKNRDVHFSHTPCRCTRSRSSDPRAPGRSTGPRPTPSGRSERCRAATKPPATFRRDEA